MNIASRLLTAALFSVTASATATAEQTFSIHQDPPTLTEVDFGGAGRLHGNILAYHANFTTKEGAKGVMHGMVTAVHVSDHKSLERVASIVLDFGGVDTIVIGGKAVYGGPTVEMESDRPQVRAIVGGTGRFIGARGQITTVRKPAGHYMHDIRLLD